MRQIAHAESELNHRQREFAYHLLDVAVKALLEFQHAAALVVRIVEHAGNAVEVEALHATGVPVVLVLVNGQPLTVNWAAQNVPAILESWFPSVQGGTAIAETLFGDYNPGGKLTIRQSHAGSSILADKGRLIPKNRQTRLSNNSSPFIPRWPFA